LLYNFQLPGETVCTYNTFGLIRGSSDIQCKSFIIRN